MRNRPSAVSCATEIDTEIQQFAQSIQHDYARLAGSASLSIKESRDAAERARRPWAQGGPPMARISDHWVDAEDVRVRVRLFEADIANDRPALIYLHGGGWTLFSLDTHDRLMREYAARTGAKVVGVDYSLAPECKFPHQIREVEAVIAWLQLNGAELGVEARRLAIGGDSAGANLAVASCMKWRDAGFAPPLHAMLLNYGAFDPAAAYVAEVAATHENYLLTNEEMKGFWRNYLRGPADVRDPLACPLLADLRGLPPAFLVIADCDILLHENLAMAALLKQAGVAVESVVYAGATHSFLEAIAVSRLSDRALSESSTWLSARMAAVNGH